MPAQASGDRVVGRTESAADCRLNVFRAQELEVLLVADVGNGALVGLGIAGRKGILATGDDVFGAHGEALAGAAIGQGARALAAGISGPANWWLPELLSRPSNA